MSHPTVARHSPDCAFPAARVDHPADPRRRLVEDRHGAMSAARPTACRDCGLSWGTLIRNRRLHQGEGQSATILPVGKDRENPFSLGAREVLQHRAGREGAVRDLSRWTSRIVDERPCGMFVPHGPHGNGKTVLPGDLRERAKGKEVRTIGIQTGLTLGSPVTLADMLAPPAWSRIPMARRLMAEMSSVSAGAGLGVLAAKTVGGALRSLLRRPLRLMVDEAHETTHPPSGRSCWGRLAVNLIRKSPCSGRLAGTSPTRTLGCGRECHSASVCPTGSACARWWRVATRHRSTFGGHRSSC